MVPQGACLRIIFISLKNLRVTVDHDHTDSIIVLLMDLNTMVHDFEI